MNDDFLSDVNAAIETVNKAPETPTNVSDLDTQQSVLGILEAHEEKPKVEKKTQQKAPVTSDVKTGDEAEQENQQQQEQKTDQQQKQQKPDNQQQQQQQQKKTVPYMDRFLQQDDKNNLVTADGTIIAMAGQSRTFFEKIKAEARAERDRNREMSLKTIQLGERFVELNNAYEDLKKDPARESIEKRTGMQGQELEEAVDLMREYKVNPVGAIKRILTQAQLRGINLKEIGINGALDPATVRGMLEEIVSKGGSQQEKTSQEPSRDAAVKEAQTFLENFPEAAEYTDILAAARRKYPNKSYAELWHSYLIWEQQQAEQEEIANAQTVVQQRQKPQQQQQQQQRQRVTSDVTQDFSKMSYGDIANSLKKEFGV